ncbi:MAG TPA: hypothetical protein PKD72_15930, partial [Gemmatales bacterium]|nr:hypothetical protein [Gemmatales bacterium]
KVQQKQVILPESSIRAAAASSEAIPDTLREFFTQSSTPSSISSSGPLLKELPAAEESKEMQRARALLRSKEGLRSVFILNEILSPPRCKRPFGRR